MRVLIVEDDAATRDVLERGLREELFRVDAVGDAAAAEDRAAGGEYDAVVLDVMLPDDDGFAVCRRLRTQAVDTPILLLSGRATPKDRVYGLDAGADDYLAKPFAFEELVARLRALTRRGRTHHLDAVLTCGPIALHQQDHLVRVNGAPVSLTATEYRLFEYLLHRVDALVTRDELARHVWGEHSARPSNIVDVYVSYLRKKLGPAGRLVKTVRGIGYTIRKDSTA